MTVVEGWLAGRLLTRPPQPSDLPPNLRTALVENMVRNNKVCAWRRGGEIQTRLNMST